MGESNTIHNQNLRKHSFKKSKVEDWPVTKMDNCFTICQCKTEEPKNIEITTPTFSEIWLFWWEKAMLFSNPKRFLSRVIIKSTGLQNDVTWVEILQLCRCTMSVVAWFNLESRIRISKAMRKCIYMLTFFMQAFLLVLSTLIRSFHLKLHLTGNTMSPVKNQDFF